jgi:addiction module RelE/StbE family toxin
MGNKLVWLQQAYDDLSALHEYISTDNGRAADAYVEEILLACERLSKFPLSGRLYNPIYRALVVRNHLVFYRYDENERQVFIVAVLHGHRNIAALFPDE